MDSRLQNNVLFGQNAKFRYLFIVALLLLFAFLGTKDIWTQEHRWADIVSGMFYRHDFLHPYLGSNQYYDKPLLSYWLIAAFSQLVGLTTWALRLPSACAGLIAIWSIYQLGTLLKDKSFGLLSGWLLLSTFYFIFWARVSSADMLNLAGILLALVWYFKKREYPSFYNYSVFFLILAVTSLCKGLVGAAVPLIAVFVDGVLHQSFKKHLRPAFFLSMLPAAIIYFLPFLASSLWGDTAFSQNGLYLVYRENVLRYFKPFDHQGPIYTYFVYLPIYLLPWTVFFIPAIYSVYSRYKNMTLLSKWITFTLLLTFLFFTFSGSRRNYYILPVVPFAILFTADWIYTRPLFSKKWFEVMIISLLIMFFLLLDVLPAWYDKYYGVKPFVSKLKSEATQIKPWHAWNIVLLDAESKLSFYLKLPPDLPHYGLKGSLRVEQTPSSLEKTWPVLLQKPSSTIFITRKRYLPLLANYFKGYRQVGLTSPSIVKSDDQDDPVAFIPIFEAV
ncbi:MAG: hypothetical protein A3F12_06765 [Gammaproteobacteria bacterium RIFCSPHIGHO2_12_FULL_38_14]|nr:MAG: hypothetical protein A3F12_06765 [Gammaproteobacteria bacterium RIFCSPHIGHO2_12_FULL_38_14]